MSLRVSLLQSTCDFNNHLPHTAEIPGQRHGRSRKLALYPTRQRGLRALDSPPSNPKSPRHGPIPSVAESTTPLPPPTQTTKSQVSWPWIRQRDGDAPISNAIVSAFQSASWIWTSEVGAPNLAPVADRAFRKTFTTISGKNASSAVVLITVDNAYVLYVNGQLIASSSTPDIPSTPQTTGINGWQMAHAYSVALTPQSNLFAVRGINFPDDQTGGEGAAGLRAAIQINYSDGTITTFRTDASWLCIKDIPVNFQSLALDDSQWTTASAIAAADQPPWGVGVLLPSVVSALPSSTATLNPTGLSDPSPTPKNSTPIGAVVGGVVGGVFVIGVLAFLLLCRKRIFKRNASSSGPHVARSHSMEAPTGPRTVEHSMDHAPLRTNNLESSSNLQRLLLSEKSRSTDQPGHRVPDASYHTSQASTSSSALLSTPLQDFTSRLNVHADGPLTTHAGDTHASGDSLLYRMQRLQDLILELNHEIAEGGADNARITELQARIAELKRQNSENVGGRGGSTIGVGSGGGIAGAGSVGGGGASALGGRGGGYRDSHYPHHDPEHPSFRDIEAEPPAYEQEAGTHMELIRRSGGK